MSQTCSPSQRSSKRELQVDQQVERAQQPLSAKTATPTTKTKPRSTATTDKPICRFFLQPDGCKNADNCQYALPRTNGKSLRCGSESHNLQACTCPVLADNSLLAPAVLSQPQPFAKRKGKAADAQSSKQGAQDKKKGKGTSKSKGRKPKPAAKSGEVDFDENAQADQDEPEASQQPDEDQEDDPEAYVVDAQSSEESDMDSDGMLDWSASECKDYKERSMATVACACPDSSVKPSDTWEWRGPCCLVRVHRQAHRRLFTPT